MIGPRTSLSGGGGGSAGVQVPKEVSQMLQTVKQNNRIIIYCGLILICSMLSFPENYRVDKRNILNQYFVKIGWFWTLLMLIPLMFANIKVDDRDSVSRAIFRLITSTIIWYTSVNFFQILDTITGFDISGHTFLLMFSNLFIASELQISIMASNALNGGSEGDKLTNSNVGLLKSQIQSIKYALQTLTILWDFMLLQTALYYHTIIQKVLAAIWAIISWYLLHRLFYQNKPTIRGLGDRCTNEQTLANS